MSLERNHIVTFTPTLSSREKQVLASLVLGKRTAEIGRELFLAHSTVRYHVAHIFVKLGVSTRTEAAVVGWEAFPMLRVLPSEWLTVPGAGPERKRSIPSSTQNRWVSYVPGSDVCKASDEPAQWEAR